MLFTVVPLHNLKLPASTRIPFGNGFVLQDVPEWVKNDRSSSRRKITPPLYCHPNDANTPVSIHHVVEAGELHAVLSRIPRKNPVWEALRAVWAGLTESSADRRYPFFWMGLEALFGP